MSAVAIIWIRVAAVCCGICIYGIKQSDPSLHGRQEGGGRDGRPP